MQVHIIHTPIYANWNKYHKVKIFHCTTKHPMHINIIKWCSFVHQCAMTNDASSVLSDYYPSVSEKLLNSGDMNAHSKVMQPWWYQLSYLKVLHSFNITEVVNVSNIFGHFFFSTYEVTIAGQISKNPIQWYVNQVCQSFLEEIFML